MGEIEEDFSQVSLTLKKPYINDILSFMFIFMLTAVPMSFFLIYSIYRIWREGRQLLSEDLIWGIRVFIISLVIFMIVRYFLKIAWDLKGLFVFLTIRDYGLWSILGFTGYYILYGLEKKSFSHKAGEIMGYLMGFYIFSGIIDTLLQFGNYDPYTLFIIPMLRIAFIFISSIMIALGGGLNIKFQILIGAGCVLLSLAGGLAGMLFYGRYLVWAWVVAGLLFTGAAASAVVIINNRR